MTKNAESQRLQDARAPKTPWKKWGPYLSERQWGTVREDYSDNGNAWDYFSHDQARSRAYHWGEDGLAGISDDKQRLCFALALWNGKDPILKERLFGLTNSEGNHGEDVKEYYFYLDSTPTHSYMKYLYKYPQAAYPYDDLVQTNRERSRQEFEYELINTGVFDQDRYFDVFVEYAKESPEDILVQISVHNRGPEAGGDSRAADALVPQSLVLGPGQSAAVASSASPASAAVVQATEAELGERYLYCDGQASLLFTENETNTQRLFGVQNRTPFVKDGINNFVVHGQTDAVNPQQTGTKVAAHYRLTVPPGKCEMVRLRLTPVAPDALSKTYGKGNGAFGKHFDEVMQTRRQEADEFYASVIPPSLDADAANVMRQALAGMLWSKQFYYFDVNRWLEERGSDPFSPSRKAAPRNEHWHHMYNADVISMPDKWEYPWYAAWDLAFHVLPLTLVDPGFRQAATRSDAARKLPAPERPDPRLRVELRRRQSAGASLGDHLHLSPGESAHGQGRHRLAGAQFPEAAAQLHLVAQPQGSLGQERLRGRIPRPGQHRRLRPQLAAADRRLPRTGRRHGLDGALQPEHARDQRRTGDAR